MLTLILVLFTQGRPLKFLSLKPRSQRQAMPGLRELAIVGTCANTFELIELENSFRWLSAVSASGFLVWAFRSYEGFRIAESVWTLFGA